MDNFMNRHDLELLNRYIERMKQEATNDKPVHAYMQEVLMNHLNTLTQSEADHIVEQIQAGIDEFNAEYNHCVDRQSSIESILNRAIKENGMDTDMASKYLSTLIVTLRTQGTNQGKITEADAKKAAENALSQSARAENMDALIKGAATAILDCSALAIDDELAQHIIKMPWSEEASSTISQAFTDPLYQGVAIYIASCKGEIKGYSVVNSPRHLGILAASGRKASDLTKDLLDGRMNKEEWISCMISNISVVFAVILISAAFVVLAAIEGGALFLVLTLAEISIVQFLVMQGIMLLAITAMLLVVGNYETLTEYLESRLRRACDGISATFNSVSTSTRILDQVLHADGLKQIEQLGSSSMDTRNDEVKPIES